MFIKAFRSVNRSSAGTITYSSPCYITKSTVTSIGLSSLYGLIINTTEVGEDGESCYFYVPDGISEEVSLEEAANTLKLEETLTN